MATQVFTQEAKALDVRNDWRTPSPWFVIVVIGVALFVFLGTSGTVDRLLDDGARVEIARPTPANPHDGPILMPMPGHTSDDPLAVAVREQTLKLENETSSSTVCNAAIELLTVRATLPAHTLLVSCP